MAKDPDLKPIARIEHHCDPSYRYTLEETTEKVNELVDGYNALLKQVLKRGVR